MHDLLFEHQHALDDSHLMYDAELCGLDRAQFAEELYPGLS